MSQMMASSWGVGGAVEAAGMDLTNLVQVGIIVYMWHLATSVEILPLLGHHVGSQRWHYHL